MAGSCSAMGCKAVVPPGLETDRLCLLHFTGLLENECAQMRRETAMGAATRERHEEILLYIAEGGEKLARVATSVVPMSDEMKSRVLNTFLTLMNFRENLDRAVQRHAAARGLTR